MGIAERLFASQIEERVAEAVERIREELRESAEQVQETTASEASAKAFATLSGAQYNPRSHDLPDGVMQRILQLSNWEYETHGLGYIIVSKVLAMVFEAGFDYQLSMPKGFPTETEAAIRKRLDKFFYDEDVDLQDRASEFVLEALLNGEHGWELEVDPVNGAVSVYDICRKDVHELHVHKRDKRRLMEVVPADDEGKARNALPVVRKDENGYLQGSCLYFRLDTRASKKRGSPIIQRIVDELQAEKKFRVLSSDRTLHRMSVFQVVTHTGATPEKVDEYSKRPVSVASGGVIHQNEKTKREMVGANAEGYEVVAIIKILITIIAGAMGMPVSWFGISDTSTQATATTQQGPAAQDSMRTKRGIVGMWEKLLYFVLDQAILAGTITQDPAQLIEVEEKDQKVQKRLRDCVTISIVPRPLAKKEPSATPLAATTAAVKIIGDAKLAEKDAGLRLFDNEDIAALLTFAGSVDGTGIEVLAEDLEAVPVQPDPEVPA